MINNTKQKLLTAIELAVAADDRDDAMAWAQVYSALVHADIQAKMTEWQTKDCPECHNDGDFPQEIG
jgi:hypothetical protein